MRKIIILLLLTLPFVSQGKDNDQLSGHWREVKRSGPDKKSMSFKDTILFHFMPGNEYVWQKAGSFIYKGTYKLENGALDIGMRYFKIVENKKNKIVLKDDQGTYEFEPYVPTSQMVAGRGPDKYGPVNSINQMVGTWDKFKGTAASTQQQIDYTRAVKKVEIFSTPDNADS